MRVRAVIDTNVLLEGLTSRGRASSKLVDLWSRGSLRACLSTALTLEYFDVLGRKLSRVRWSRLEPLVGRLVHQSEFVDIFFTWRPRSPDPADEHIIDCAMSAGAPVVTHNLRDFERARSELGLKVYSPDNFLRDLERREVNAPKERS